MPDDRTPSVIMSWDWWCAAHLEPLRAEWPKGAGLAMLGLFNAASAHPDVVAACDHDAHNLQGVLELRKPLCCLVGDTTARQITDDALAGIVYGLPTPG